MSSYSYQPKVFRYKNGCCICKAKSSSSRFTSSQKYESEFLHCFNLREQRTGKICNACVLIFKRWRKLPDKYSRNWEHVIDSKDKQGRKVRTRKCEKATELPDKVKFEKKHRYIPRARYGDDSSDDQGLGEDISSSSASSIAGEERLSEGVVSMPCSLAPSPQPRLHYPCYEELGSQRRKGPKGVIVKKIDISKLLKEQRSDFLTKSYWTEYHICCGTIWEGQKDEVAVDTTFRYCGYCSQLFRRPSTIPTNSRRPENEEVDIYESPPLSSNSYYNQQLNPEHSAGLHMLLQFSRALAV